MHLNGFDLIYRRGGCISLKVHKDVDIGGVSALVILTMVGIYFA